MSVKVFIGGREVTPPLGATIVFLSKETYSVLLDGKSYVARVDGSSIHVNGVEIPFELVDPRELVGSGSAAGAGGRAQLVAPMPGKVVRVLVEEGQEVLAGQGILVVEAMKMQNEMQAPRAGKVVSLQAKAGAAVSAGDVLAVVE